MRKGNNALVAQSNIAVELAKLEADTGQISLIDEKLKAFNVFEVLGVQRRELQHSNFLAYLLNPSERHGFGAKFLKAFFEAALRLANREQTRITMAQVNRLAQSQSCLVVREWDRNDIRIRDPRSRLVCVIENKIGASESDGQLSKYRRGIERQFKSYSSLFVYLTPDREDPTDDRWVRLGYHDIAEVLETVLRGGRKRLNSAPYSTVEQYVQTIRRHVVKDEELAQRARDFYEKHQQVLDFILENRPSYAQSLHEQLRREIGRNSKLRLDDESSQYFRFRPKEWDHITGLNKKESWNDGSLLAIELDTPLGPGGKLDLHIVIHVESAPRLGRAIFEALEGHKTKNKTFAWAKRKKIAPVPTELNGNFNDNVSADVMSYVSQELPSITAQIKRTALKYSKAVS